MDRIIKLPFQLPGDIFRSPMPFGPYDPDRDVFVGYKSSDISIAVILVEEHEWWKKANLDLPDLYKQAGLDVIHLPIPDYGVPETGGLGETLDKILEEAQAGKNIVVHCSAGIGRTGLFMAVLARKVLGFSGQEAIDWVRRFIPGAIETKAQEEFIITQEI
ncbi:MAG: tyrosine-protein phosphatase [Anaerolineaceae bacterium]|nr:tyrosine-protein phosphatase [Anaerolineaceae bacterium]